MTLPSKNSLSSSESSSCTTWTAVVDLVKPLLNFLPQSVSKAVKLNIPRGVGGVFQRASAPPNIIS